MNYFISTIDPKGASLARAYGLGIEIAEYCTAWNMDDALEQTNQAVKRQLTGIKHSVLHGPFNELFPCAIDPKARALAADRYRQAINLAKKYGAEKVVLHGGYNPYIYYPAWYQEQSVLFWKQFLQEDPGIPIVLENVLEDDPGLLLRIVAQVDDPRLRMCLDIGHANAYSDVPVMTWLEQCAPYITHFHIHNNDGDQDTHSPLLQGSIPIAAVLERASALCPDRTVTLELPDASDSVLWLLEEAYATLD